MIVCSHPCIACRYKEEDGHPVPSFPYLDLVGKYPAGYTVAVPANSVSPGDAGGSVMISHLQVNEGLEIQLGRRTAGFFSWFNLVLGRADNEVLICALLQGAYEPQMCIYIYYFFFFQIYLYIKGEMS